GAEGTDGFSRKGRDMETVTKKPETLTDAEREQAAEIKAATARATTIRRKELEVTKLRKAQHAFILKANNPPPGWKKLTPVRISEIVKISRPRIHENITRATPQEAAVGFDETDSDMRASV